MKRKWLQSLLLLIAPVIWTQQQCMASNPDSLYRLGAKYFDKQPAGKNLLKAKTYLLSAVQGNCTNNVMAMAMLGDIYSKQAKSRADVDSAVYCYSRAMDGNSSAAYYGMGMLYYHGLFSVAQDFSKAAACFYKGMALGNPNCKNMVAFCLYKGLNQKQDYDSAFLLYHQVSLQVRHRNAMYFLGLLYRNGYGTQRNIDSATYWLTQSAHLGYLPAKGELASISPENPIEPIAPPAEKTAFESNAAYRRIKHNMSAKSLPGTYSGYAIRYDWSGKHVLGVFPLRVVFNNNEGDIKGMWIEEQHDTANIDAIFTDSSLNFNDTRYTKWDHYATAHNKKEAMQFVNARLNLLQQPDSLYITGNVQLYDLERGVPGRPMYVHLSRASTIADKNEGAVASLMVIKASPNPFQDRIRVQFSLQNTKRVTLSLTDIQGKLLATDDAGLLAPGTYQHDMPISDKIAAGSYLLIVNTGDLVKQVILIKK